ncbi:MAG: hypothetical protein GX483_01000 [Actinomycetaceae bacterium]|nr:hypothetical protein [Actinomycetaceae bacterium]
MDATRYLAPMIVFGLLSIVMIVLALIVRFSGARNTYRETWQYVEVASQRGIIRMSYAEIVDYRIGYSTLHLCDSRGQSATIYYRLYSMPHLISYLYKMNPADERIDLLAARSRHPNAQPLIEDSESELRS